MEDKIEVNPKIMLGKPVIKGTRVTVEHILKLFKQGQNTKEILEDYPHLKRIEVEAAVDFALESLNKERVFPLNRLHS